MSREDYYKGYLKFQMNDLVDRKIRDLRDPSPEEKRINNYVDLDQIDCN